MLAQADRGQTHHHLAQASSPLHRRTPLPSRTQRLSQFTSAQQDVVKFICCARMQMMSS